MVTVAVAPGVAVAAVAVAAAAPSVSPIGKGGQKLVENGRPCGFG